MSSPNFEQIASAQKANAEVMTAMLRTALNGMERLTALNMAATRDFLNSSMSNTQRLLAAKDANALGKLQGDLAQPRHLRFDFARVGDPRRERFLDIFEHIRQVCGRCERQAALGAHRIVPFTERGNRAAMCGTSLSSSR